MPAPVGRTSDPAWRSSLTPRPSRRSIERGDECPRPLPRANGTLSWSLPPAWSTASPLMHGRHVLEQGLDRLPGLRRRHHGHDLELDQIAPERDPLLQPRIIALHELKATVEVRLDAAADVAQPVRGAAALLAQAAVARLGIAILERDRVVLNGRGGRSPSASGGGTTGGGPAYGRGRTAIDRT
jgi:hypothetical protein